MSLTSNGAPFSGSDFKMKTRNCSGTASVAISKKRQAARLPYNKNESSAEVRAAPAFPIHLTLATVTALCLLFGCETTNYAPRVRTTSRDFSKLERGRTLFVHRCIECHTLPPIWKYSREDWPKIVNDMSHRASLKPAERDAVVAYILAARKEL
jgi:mono/diheme cytochrome c family protein